ncbi:MAG: bifunctional diguanylate cyclase/phosphodiesterase [Pseudomonadota bacterium]
MASSIGKLVRLNEILDALASRVGIFVVVGLLVAVCISVGWYVQSVVIQLERNHEVLKDAQLRNGYTAISDVNRLVLISQKTATAGRMTPELENDFIAAADVLYVRIDNFKTVMDRGGEFDYGRASIAALERILATADGAINSSFSDPRGITESLLHEAESARQYLVRFLDATRRHSDLVLEQQSIAVRKQQVVVLANLIGFTIVGTGALLLLRREVLERRAREKAEKRVEFLAFFDPLTELPNRVQFQDRLHAILNEDPSVALLYIDLDDFKTINDTYGHAAGDAILRHVATTLSRLAKVRGGFAARLAGDEFAIVVPSVNDTVLSLFCESLVSCASKSFDFEGESLEIKLSIGAATSGQVSERMPIHVDSLCRVADFALYAAKTSGRNRFALYDHDLEDKFLARRSMVEELPRAIEKKQLEVYLQPKVMLDGREVYGFEALVRWGRNNQIVPPSEFIVVAEESGLVVDIDTYVLNEATRLIANWNRIHQKDFSVSINLSALHFSSHKIVERVQDALWRSELSPNLLTLEITETRELRDWQKAGEILDSLNAVGCKISLDDFGTGYSSLAYLRTKQADEIKIDKSLVDELETSDDACQLLSSVIEISQKLELEVVVEGIETEGQAQIVQDMGVLQGQGFLFGRPMTASDALGEAQRSQKFDDRRLEAQVSGARH